MLVFQVLDLCYSKSVKALTRGSHSKCQLLYLLTNLTLSTHLTLSTLLSPWPQFFSFSRNYLLFYELNNCLLSLLRFPQRWALTDKRRNQGMIGKFQGALKLISSCKNLWECFMAALFVHV